ncbi:MULTISPECIES: hypothetical protein [Candidatus Accumulibacter]|uniref:Uncharacterized protein n=1 Tax=Candidatus Accumulibacter cognatus TaxID=2954383 RepID=A0A080M295_9PROT|nr:MULTISPECIES: hypothetical protein [Candidatus Accumulibacter]KFB75383.1 MAG: hypothetical protein AW06_003552 [Candidatus Accumulibacter cognatus]QLH49956.1 MAG: hypothetical protein HWD57_09320 [Candidatus Accumulibacter cognatus]
MLKAYRERCPVLRWATGDARAGDRVRGCRRRGTYLRSYALAFIEKVCPEIGEEYLKAVAQKQNGSE